MKKRTKEDISLFNTIFLPFFWYRSIVNLWPLHVKSAPISKELASIYESVWRSICSYDRSFLDRTLKEIDTSRFGEKNRMQADCEIGMALYDLGCYDEGIGYLERAVQRFFDNMSVYPIYVPIFLCYRLNQKKHWEKRLNYFLLLKRFFPDEELVDIGLAKSYIEENRYTEAKAIMQKLVNLHSFYVFLFADYYYAQKQYEDAAKIFDSYAPSELLYDYWGTQFDYKKATAYYKTNQTRKWKNAAKKMGRRLKWDRFYHLDTLEEEGVERIDEIDRVINFYKNKRIFVDPVKTGLFVRRLPRVLWAYCRCRRVVFWYSLVGILWLVLRLAKIMG